MSLPPSILSAGQRRPSHPKFWETHLIADNVISKPKSFEKRWVFNQMIGIWLGWLDYSKRVQRYINSPSQKGHVRRIARNGAGKLWCLFRGWKTVFKKNIPQIWWVFHGDESHGRIHKTNTLETNTAGKLQPSLPFVVRYTWTWPLLFGIFRTLRSKGIFVFSPQIANSLPSLKLTAKALKNGGWKTILSFWVSAFFSGNMLVFGGMLHFPSMVTEWSVINGAGCFWHSSSGCFSFYKFLTDHWILTTRW